MHIGSTGHLYGLHRFHVGGAQALALAGRSVLYTMSRGRCKSSESVARYVEAPAYVQCADANDSFHRNSGVSVQIEVQKIFVLE